MITIGEIKINDIVYGTDNASSIIYKNTTVEEKLDTIPVFDPSDNTYIEANQYDYLTYGHIVDTLTSNDSNKILSAKQGKVLNDKIRVLEEEPQSVVIKMTQADYDALPDSKYSDGILYAIIDDNGDAEGGMIAKPVELTKAQYEALGDSVLNDNILYAITDTLEFRVNNKIYGASYISNEDGSKVTVQEKINELENNLTSDIPFKFGKNEEGQYGYIVTNEDGADTVVPFKSKLPDFNIDIYIQGVNSNLSGSSRFQYLNTDKNYKYLKYSYNGYIDIKLMGDSTVIYSCASISASSGINSKTAIIDISNYSKIYVTSTSTGYTNGTLNLTFTNNNQ